MRSRFSAFQVWSGSSVGCWSEDSRHWYQTWIWLVFFQQVLEWCFMIWGLSIVYVNFQTRQHQNLSDWSRPLFGRLWNENLLSKQCKISDIRHSCSCHSFTMEEQIIFNQDFWIMVIEGFNWKKKCEITYFWSGQYCLLTNESCVCFVLWLL